MRAPSGTVILPLDWPGLVEEALRRRRAEGLTQKEHAALAGVSVPTMVSFDRKELTLSLAKAIDILQVVGLVAKQSALDALEEFRRAADRRWEELVATLPPAAPGRMETGHYTFYYQIAGAAASSSRKLQDALRKADRKYTGWPPFRLPTRQLIAAYPFDDGVECWLGKPDAERAFDDAAHADFWRASLDARLYLRRGFQEDSTDVLPPATIFDLTLPIWRTGEALLHAYHLGEALDARPEAEVEFRVRYAGLAGRELKSWANPHRSMLDDHRSRMGHAESAVHSPVAEIADRLPELVHALLAPVYELFDFFELPPAIVSEELDRLRSDRTRRRPSS